MTPLEQVRDRVEHMRKTNTDSNQLCKLLDFVNKLVEEEKELDRKCERITDSSDTAWD